MLLAYAVNPRPPRFCTAIFTQRERHTELGSYSNTGRCFPLSSLSRSCVYYIVQRKREIASLIPFLSHSFCTQPAVSTSRTMSSSLLLWPNGSFRPFATLLRCAPIMIMLRLHIYVYFLVAQQGAHYSWYKHVLRFPPFVIITETMMVSQAMYSAPASIALSKKG